MAAKVKYRVIALGFVILSIMVACNQEEADTEELYTFERKTTRVSEHVWGEIEESVIMNVEILADGTIIETIADSFRIPIKISDHMMEYFDGDSWIDVHRTRHYDIEGGGIRDADNNLIFKSHLEGFYLPSESGLFRIIRFVHPMERQPWCTLRHDLIGEFYLEE